MNVSPRQSRYLVLRWRIGESSNADTPPDLSKHLTRKSGGFRRSGQRSVPRHLEAALSPGGVLRACQVVTEGESEKVGGVVWEAYCSLPTRGKSMFYFPSSVDADLK